MSTFPGLPGSPAPSAPSAPSPPPAARSALLAGLVDDAALFPPGNAAMPEAVAGHRALLAGPYAALVGKFLCRASRLADLRAHLSAEDGLSVGIIADTGTGGLPQALEQVRSEPRLRLAGIEIALPEGMEPAAAAQEVLAVLPATGRVFVELPRVPGWRDALAAVAAAARGAKLRTGGLSAQMFPKEHDVADFIQACVDSSVAFKCTAGLHRAVRHSDPVTGFEHHGFLNIVLATVAAVRGEDVVAALAERDAEQVGASVAGLDAVLTAAVRAHFAGFGSCSIDEPVEDLEKLGLW